MIRQKNNGSRFVPPKVMDVSFIPTHQPNEYQNDGIAYMSNEAARKTALASYDLIMNQEIQGSKGMHRQNSQLANRGFHTKLQTAHGWNKAPKGSRLGLTSQDRYSQVQRSNIVVQGNSFAKNQPDYYRSSITPGMNSQPISKLSQLPSIKQNLQNIQNTSFKPSIQNIGFQPRAQTSGTSIELDSTHQYVNNYYGLGLETQLHKLRLNPADLSQNNNTGSQSSNYSKQMLQNKKNEKQLLQRVYDSSKQGMQNKKQNQNQEKLLQSHDEKIQSVLFNQAGNTNESTQNVTLNGSQNYNQYQNTNEDVYQSPNFGRKTVYQGGGIRAANKMSAKSSGNYRYKKGEMMQQQAPIVNGKKTHGNKIFNHQKASLNDVNDSMHLSRGGSVTRARNTILKSSSAKKFDMVSRSIDQFSLNNIKIKSEVQNIYQKRIHPVPVSDNLLTFFSKNSDNHDQESSVDIKKQGKSVSQIKSKLVQKKVQTENSVRQKPATSLTTKTNRITNDSIFKTSRKLRQDHTPDTKQKPKKSPHLLNKNTATRKKEDVTLTIDKCRKELTESSIQMLPKQKTQKSVAVKKLRNAGQVQMQFLTQTQSPEGQTRKAMAKAQTGYNKFGGIEQGDGLQQQRDQVNGTTMQLMNQNLKQTDDFQIQQYDSDDEYEQVKETVVSNVAKLRNNQIYSPGSPGGSPPRLNSISPKLTMHEEMSMYNNARQILIGMKKLKNQKNTKMVQNEVKKTHRENQVEKKLNDWIGDGGSSQDASPGASLEPPIDKSQLNPEHFKLISHMSKTTRISNNFMNNVIDTLNMSVDGDTKKSKQEKQQNKQDTSQLLYQTNASIKNLNHSLIKLVATQQQSISIIRQIQSKFVMMDRVPVFLEIDAKGIPYPCKINLKPMQTRHSTSEAVFSIIKDFMNIYVSTQTKNPNARNNQMKIEAPVKKSFEFSPPAEQGKGEIFQDKIFITIIYEITASGDGSDLAPAILEELAQIQMLFLASFPKDKEEVQKKKMAIMLKKLGGSKEDKNMDGEQRLAQINQQLTTYYKDNKDIVDKKQGQTTRRLSPSSKHTTKVGNIQTQRQDRNGSNEKMQSVRTQQLFKRDDESVGEQQQVAIPFNQLVDMYAFGTNQVFGRNESAKDLNVSQKSFEQGEQSIAMDSNLGTIAGTVANINDTNHIARNAFVSGQYKQMSGIRSQLNTDILYTRLFNSQQRAQIKDNEQRLKSMQWLNKWDEFRHIKRQYAEKVLEILKSRRRVMNMIAMITVATHLQGILNSYAALKKYRMRQFTQVIYAIKLKHRYNNVFKKKNGVEFGFRQRNQIRKSMIYLTATCLFPMHEQRAKRLFLRFLTKSGGTNGLRSHLYIYHEKIQHIQGTYRRLIVQRKMNQAYSVLRLRQEFNRLRAFYQKKSLKSKPASKILTALNDINLFADESHESISTALSKYRQIQCHNYQLNCKEMLFNQLSLYMKYLSEENPKMEQIKKQTVKFGEQMELHAFLVGELESEIYGVSQLVVKQLNKDTPHDLSREYVDEVQVCDKKKFKAQQEDGDVPTPPPETASPKKVKVSKKDQAKEEKLQKKLEKLKLQKKQRVEEVNQIKMMNMKNQYVIQKIHSSKERKLHALSIIKHPSQMFDIQNSRGNISILQEQDKQQSFYSGLEMDIQEEGLNHIEPFFIWYKRYDMIRILFKMAKIDEILDSGASNEPEKEA